MDAVVKRNVAIQGSAGQSSSGHSGTPSTAVVQPSLPAFVHAPDAGQSLFVCPNITPTVHASDYAKPPAPASTVPYDEYAAAVNRSYKDDAEYMGHFMASYMAKRKRKGKAKA
jgi:hypothetical protein